MAEKVFKQLNRKQWEALSKSEQKEFNKSYIAHHLPMFKKHCEGTGLNPEMLLAQTAKESQYGISGLSHTDFNYGGQKYKGDISDPANANNFAKYYTPEDFKTKAKADAFKKEQEAKGFKTKFVKKLKREDGTYYYRWRGQQAFKKFANAEDGIKAQVEFFSKSKWRYKNVGKVEDPYEQIEAIKNAGYATDSTGTYVSDIIEIYDDITKEDGEYYDSNMEFSDSTLSKVGASGIGVPIGTKGKGGIEDSPWKTWDELKLELDSISETKQKKDDPKTWKSQLIKLDKIISDKKIEAENKKLKEEKEDPEEEAQDAIDKKKKEAENRVLKEKEKKKEVYQPTETDITEVIDAGPNTSEPYQKDGRLYVMKDGVETLYEESKKTIKSGETIEGGPGASEPYQKDGKVYVMENGVETLYEEEQEVKEEFPNLLPEVEIKGGEVEEKKEEVVEKQQLEESISTIETEEIEVLDANGNIKKITVPTIKPVEPVLTNVDADGDSIPDGIDIDGGTDSNIPPPGVEPAAKEKPKPIKPRMRDFKNSSGYMKARMEYYKNVEGEENTVGDYELDDEEIKEAVDMEQNAKTIDASKRNIFKTNGRSNIFNSIIGDINKIASGIEQELNKFTKSLNNKE